MGNLRVMAMVAAALGVVAIIMSVTSKGDAVVVGLAAIAAAILSLHEKS